MTYEPTLETILRQERPLHFDDAFWPLLRSSDLRGLADPFSWFLTRRLGLTPALSHSKALSRGSWFHAAFHAWRGRYSDSEALHRYETTLSVRLSELIETCDRIGLDGDRRRSVLEREERDALTAWTWFQASRKVPVPSLHGSANQRLPWTDWLLSPQFRWLAVEPILREGSHLAQPDLVLWHEPQNSVWIVDLKTCTGSPLARLDGCRGEFQTHHYLTVLRDLLKSGIGKCHWNLPPDVRVGGFIHIAIAKPLIELSGEDRDYTLDTTPLKSGPRKGEPRNERVFSGEPKLSRYRERVEEWFLSQGRYVHLRGERATDPTVNASIVSAAVLDDPWLREIHRARVRAVENQLLNREPFLPDYPAVGDTPAPWDKSPLFPLRYIPPGDWLRWCSAAQFTVSARSDINLPASPGIYPNPQVPSE